MSVSTSCFTLACSSEELLGRYPRQTGVVDGGAGGQGELPSSLYRGPELLAENFEDTAYAGRGWYDIGQGGLVTEAHAALGQRSFECRFPVAAEACAEGRPGRHLFDPQEAVFISYQVRYSDHFMGAAELYVLTTEDPAVIGPALSHFAAFIVQNEGRWEVTFTDNANVNPACVQLESGETIGCAGGSVQAFDFGEDRSLNGCNGVFSNPSRWTCSTEDVSPSGYGNYRSWMAEEVSLSSEPGPAYKGNWHLVELYLRLNSVRDGVGIADGELRLWFDSKLLIVGRDMLLRSGLFPQLRLHQLLLVPWVNRGAEVEQTLHIDDLRVAVGVQP